ncbi:hypothetical protein K488DRAFT_48043 [Vararia minispora EC-137]|uniref:Uncharacterized protein n=1 Tax=Vararia minispora EC-137 TaxID=1314806 RepID=A0ACB8QNQ2_9AGAM|nr:hypothetical protein K488DRAFT_48043 [Vararia minispora EC-137]
MHSPPAPGIDFEVERNAATGSPQRPGLRRGISAYASEAQAVLEASVAQLAAAKARPFTVSGRIPVDPASLNLFFRTKSGITHSLDFPIDVDYDTPPALDVLLAASQPYPIPDDAPELASAEADALFFPPHLPLTTTLEIANHPILDAIRATLFPALPTGHYLTALRDRLEIVPAGARLVPQPPPADGRVATLLVTLPVRHRGGALHVRAADGALEVFAGRGGRAGQLDWAAFFSDCDAEVERVTKGCRVSIAYAVQLRTFGPAGGEPLIAPSDAFLDALAPVLNIMRGRIIAFHLSGEYGVSPAEVIADSLVPYLKGGDSLLYHAFKLYRLSPELRWTAGGYVWPVDSVIDMNMGSFEGSPYAGARRTPFAGYADLPVDGAFEGTLQRRVEASGGIPLAQADVVVLTDKFGSGAVSKERVPFVSGGQLDKLIVNILICAYVP